MQIYSPGTRIGQYEIASRPMMGGMGVVYFALDHSNDGRPVALKTFRPELLPDREARDRFLREGTAWVELGSHPNIVRCHKVEYIDPTAFLVLELIAKEQGMEDASLRSWMGSPMKVDQALLFGLQIARGLQHANNKIPGFVHRDLKPENVLVGADKLLDTNVNRLRVTDFGLAAVLNKEDLIAEGLDNEQERALSIGNHLNLLSIGHIVGTPEYMAPEQWEQGIIDCRADIYAMGCILLEMLSGQITVKAVSQGVFRELHKGGEALRKVSAFPGISQDVRLLLEKSLAVNPSQRYVTWSDLIKGLEKSYTAHSGRVAPAEMSTAQTSREERLQDGWSHGAMGAAYMDMGKVEVAKGYFEKSLSIVREIGDRRGEGDALGNLGAAYYRLGEVRRAIGYYEKSLAIAREIGDRRGEGASLGNLGVACKDLGEVQRAIGYFEQALAIDRELGNRRGEGHALGNLGATYHQLGEVRRAIGYYEQYLAIARAIGDRRGEGTALGNLGLAYVRFGEVRRAIGYYEQYLAIAHEIGDQRGEGNALGSLGSAYLNLGELRRAIGYYEQRIEIAREIGDRHGEGNALGNLGIVYNNLGDTRRAIEYYEQAIVIRREIGDINGTAADLFNMALLYAQQGETARALSLAQEAERIWSQIGNPYAKRAQQFIAQLSNKQNSGLLGRLFSKK